MGPTFAGFLNFVRVFMSIGTGVLPDDSPFLQPAYDSSITLVNVDMALVPSPRTSPSFYATAVYNLAGDFLVNIAQDQPDAPNVPGSAPPAPYFRWLRQTLNLNSFVGGVITASNDETTGESMTMPDFVKQLTMMDLQTLKTPWGRAYMAAAQQYGYIVGIN